MRRGAASRSERARCLSSLGSSIACAVACAAPVSAPPASAPPAPAPASSTPPPQAQLSVAAPVGPDVPPSAESDDGSMKCVTPPDPELDQESPWSKELGQQLALELPNLRRCSQALPAGSEAQMTLRLVYAADGSPLSQHVVSSSPEACVLAECAKQELADVHATTLEIERGSFDLALSFERGKVPKRSPEPVDPLATDDAPPSCVDPEILRLTRATVRDIVSTTHDKLKQCYGQALMRRHDAAGTVTFEFVIGQQGEMASVQARESTLYDCGAIQCMLAEFRPLHFPAPVGRSVRVVYPIKYVLEQQPVNLR